MNKYNFGYIIPLDSTNDWAYNQIKENSNILEFGPANGMLTKNLKERLKCTIDIVEIDEEAGQVAGKFARDSLIGSVYGNIEKYYWLEKLTKNKYDYIIFLDVLEHLYEPMKALESAKSLLKEEGSIIVSIPNIAHNSIIIDLINNKFNYTKLGLLDNTHVRFFTYDSVVEMIRKSGLTIYEQGAIQLGVGENEIVNSYSDVPHEVETSLRMRNMADIYQFLFTLKKGEDVRDTYNLGIEKLNVTKCPVNIYLKDKEEGFIETKVIRLFSELQNIHISIDLSDYKGIDEIRIDIGYCYKIVKRIKLMGDDLNSIDECRLVAVNGRKVDEETYVILGTVPQIVYDVKERKRDILHFSCQCFNTVEHIDMEKLADYRDVDAVQEEFNKLQKLYTLTEEERVRVTNECKILEADREKIIKRYNNLEEEHDRLQQHYIEKVEDMNEVLKIRDILLNDCTDLQRQKVQLDSILKEIYNSKGWRLLCAVRKIKHKLWKK